MLKLFTACRYNKHKERKILVGIIFRLNFHIIYNRTFDLETPCINLQNN